MPFLPPNQQHQSTEGNLVFMKIISVLIFKKQRRYARLAATSQLSLS